MDNDKCSFPIWFWTGNDSIRCLAWPTPPHHRQHHVTRYSTCTMSYQKYIRCAKIYAWNSIPCLVYMNNKNNQRDICHERATKGSCVFHELTRVGWYMYAHVNWAIISSSNCLWLILAQAIIWTNVHELSIAIVKLREIWINILQLKLKLKCLQDGRERERD